MSSTETETDFPSVRRASRAAQRRADGAQRRGHVRAVPRPRDDPALHRPQDRLADRRRRRQHVRRPRLGLGVEPAGRLAGAGARPRDRRDAPLRVRDHRLRPQPAADRARRAPGRARPGEHHPGRDRDHRHRGGRGRGEARARGDRPADDPRLPRPVPRRGHVPDRRRVDRPLRGHLELGPVRVRARLRPLPEPVPRPVPQGPRALRRHDLRRLPGGGAAAPPGRPRADRRGADRAGARRGRDRDPLGRVLEAADRASASATAGC